VIPAQAAADAGVYPDVDALRNAPTPAAPVAPVAPAAPEFALGEIPDLAPAPRERTTTKKSSPPPTYSRALDFDETPSQNPIELDVDLGPGERPGMRVSDSGALGTERHRISSGAQAAVQVAADPGSVPPRGGFTSSGSFPVAVPTSSPPTGRARMTTGDHPRTSQSGRPQVPSHPGTSSPSWPRADASLPPTNDYSFGAPEPPSVIRRVAPGAALVVLAILVTLGNQMYAASAGEVFSLGAIKATWIAGLFMLAGVVLIAIRLIPSQRQ
jgi:hypothetical protein